MCIASFCLCYSAWFDILSFLVLRFVVVQVRQIPLVIQPAGGESENRCSLFPSGGGARSESVGRPTSQCYQRRPSGNEQCCWLIHTQRLETLQVEVQLMMAGGMYFRAAGKVKIPLASTWAGDKAPGSWALADGRRGSCGEVHMQLEWRRCETPTAL
jgi:hypothetical protein